MFSWGGGINYHIHPLAASKLGYNEMFCNRDGSRGGQAFLNRWRCGSCLPPREIEIYAVYPADCCEGKEPIAACSEV